jgi:UDP-N-acetylmuramoylalanine--D-glutamate ligase
MPAPLRVADLANRRVAIWGYGREGRATLAALRRRFPAKPLTLFCSLAEASSMPAGEKDTPVVDVVTAAPDSAALMQFDVVIKSPGISPYRSPVPEAEHAGVRFTSGTALWFAEHPRRARFA